MIDELMSLLRKEVRRLDAEQKPSPEGWASLLLLARDATTVYFKENHAER